MAFWSKKHKEKGLADEDFIDLKETVWHLQAVSASLQETHEQLAQTVEHLRDLNRASPNYLSSIVIPR